MTLTVTDDMALDIAGVALDTAGMALTVIAYVTLTMAARIVEKPLTVTADMANLFITAVVVTLVGGGASPIELMQGAW